MNDLKNIKNAGEAVAPEAPMTEMPAAPTAETPARRRPSRPAAVIGCITAAISLGAFAFLAYFQILAIAAVLEPPPTEGIDARRLGLALGWLFSLICGAPQLVFGITSAICLRRAEKRTALRYVRLATVLLLLVAVLSTAVLTGYILTSN